MWEWTLQPTTARFHFLLCCQMGIQLLLCCNLVKSSRPLLGPAKTNELLFRFQVKAVRSEISYVIFSQCCSFLPVLLFYQHCSSILLTIFLLFFFYSIIFIFFYSSLSFYSSSTIFFFSSSFSYSSKNSSSSSSSSAIFDIVLFFFFPTSWVMSLFTTPRLVHAGRHRWCQPGSKDLGSWRSQHGGAAIEVCRW